MKYLLILFLIFSSLACDADHKLTRHANESDTAFVARALNDAAEEIVAVYPISFSGPRSPDLVFLHKRSAGSETNETDVTASLLVQCSDKKYSLVHVDSYGPEGSVAQIRSVFAANADKDPARELLVLVSWPQNHPGVSGNLFRVYVYDDARNVEQKKLLPLTGVSNKFGIEFTGMQEGQKKAARYTNASSIRKRLLALGYKQ